MNSGHTDDSDRANPVPDRTGSEHPGTNELDDDFKASLAGLGRLAMSTMSLPETLSHVAEFAVRAIPGADGAGLTLLHPDLPATIVASADFVRVVDDIQNELGQGPSVTAAAEAITVRSGCLDADSRWPEFGPLVRELGVHSVLSLPLTTKSVLLGSMNVYAHRPDAFDDQAAALGELFAVPVAITVQNARALDSAVQLTEQLEKALSTRAVIDQAIGILISKTGCSDVEAYDTLRSIGHTEHEKLAVVAQSMVVEAMKAARTRHRST
ncbi:GAF and ANTAR domain-containing protein [Rhodococcoides yunnanense]|uniref:GAF and ANTAR domain-containing protein n=1 Tax=Rhodococcoides yunnanense TaxID=278209 RepID=A0ABU4B6W1_9NOCA|nr:GAF and ANTAR domain-containing protein [Rhodococcus yunnanensis]MDV6259927.1 GAF and ANTAR domain-containing protein [Rhodococcus yunnanensis]